MLKIISYSDRMRDIVSETAGLMKLATGYVWSEGPIWNNRTQELFYTDFTLDEIYGWNPGRGVRTVRRDSARSCGLAFDRQGRILCAETTTRSVTRIEPDGSVTTLVSRYKGKGLNSPNDVIVHSGGDIYFTDPFSADTGNKKLVEENGVYKLDIHSGELILLADLTRPNGLAFSPDGSLLYVDDTQRQEVYAFDVLPDGGLGAQRLFASLDSGVGPGRADGMKVDEHGNVYVTGPAGIWVFTPEGEALGVISVGEIAANLCWGGREFRTLFITAQSSVYSLDMLVRGASDSSRYC